MQVPKILIGINQATNTRVCEQFYKVVHRRIFVENIEIVILSCILTWSSLFYYSQWLKVVKAQILELANQGWDPGCATSSHVISRECFIYSQSQVSHPENKNNSIMYLIEVGESKEVLYVKK